MKRKLIVVSALIIFNFQLSSCKKKESACSTDVPTVNIACEGVNMGANVNGFIVNYYPNTTQKESEGNYTNGVQVGFWKFYYENGNLLKEVSFENGKVDGFAKKYFENGNLASEGNFENCVKHGFWKFYHNDTKNLVFLEGEYTNDEQTGEWKRYDKDGKLEKQSTCE
ncbi:MAG: hypothetical protein N4A35_16070 [Flavobacteriales bacterium]|jgi:antitoxin component YwqK of YwqJK toxin-antitoxin module|nr:hypothetical protein [Flavobacteriales bacterium]